MDVLARVRDFCVSEHLGDELDVAGEFIEIGRVGVSHRVEMERLSGDVFTGCGEMVSNVFLRDASAVGLQEEGVA